MSHSPTPRPSDELIDILLVEDNPGDVRLVREAFAEADFEVSLHTIANGDDAVEFLTAKTTDEPVSVPDLVLLDLNLPGRDGCAVLEAIREDSQLACLPVIMLTSSSAEEDIARCYGASVNAYLTKPTAPDEFVSLIEILESFWFERVRLPPIPS
ncbi:response regulator [Halobacteria archaeon AArc-m2/3/4]|uniref:Response regulator n=1 Tax=Natronoglomus mannanivorans TaxID=2979990 RepID=A0AAP2YW11_9EURY|nr:response regulator [Halobacteria archaeon AArc-xg1-1]MCU4972806.1 response regulator [Halobacteria archaeon AArc-m2/3/4]